MVRAISGGRKMKRAWTLALSVLGLMALGTGTAHAAVLMLDFGPTAASGTNLTNSPGHEAGAVATDASGQTWNTVGTADPGALLYADNTAATGVALNLGRLTSGTVIDLGAQPGSSSALGSSKNEGIYSGNSVGKDAIFQSPDGSRVGAQVTGLAAGTYEVYVTAQNPISMSRRPRRCTRALVSRAIISTRPLWQPPPSPT